jgi:DNA-binding XRE family transcriptional regulator
VTSDEIKALRAELRCTTRELADALEVDQKTVLAWESGELFPTKKHCVRMATLREQGPSAIPRRAKGAAPPPMQVLADPEVWAALRKIVAHRKLRDEVLKLAASYDDPAG